MNTTTQTTTHSGAPARASGLEGVVVADTALSHVDGERGHLVVRGQDIEVLARDTGFEAAWVLLWQGRAAAAGEAEAARERLGAARVEAWRQLEPALGAVLGLDDVMAAIAAGLALAPPRGDAEEEALRLVATVPVVAAAWHARREGRTCSRPDASSAHAADVLRLLGGPLAGAREGGSRAVAHADARARALEAYLVTVMDHGMNASTFTARVVASTGARAAAAVSAAVGALSGPLHGGAPGPVLDMLDQVAAAGDAEAWLSRELAAGRRIMGMGHRIYRVRDPRVVVLERATAGLAEVTGATPRLAVARQVEAAAERLLVAKYPDRALKANVELATAVLLDAVGVPRELFSAMFAVGRVVGWVAHVAEQRATGRLIRPESRYVGEGLLAPA